MAEKQQFIIEGIAKVDNILDGIKKIQASLGNLKVPDTTQRQIDTLTKRMEQQGEKAKKAISSGFETKSSVKNYTDALNSISRIYGEIIDKAKELKLDKNLSLSADTSELEKSNKALEQFEANLKTAKKEAVDAKNAAQKVFTGVANAYSKNKNPFQEWSEAAKKFKNGDIQGVKQELDKIEQKFQGKDTTNHYWAPKVASYEKLKLALESYEAAQNKAIVAQQAKDAQEQVSAKYTEAARKELEKTLQTMEKAATEAQNMADAEGESAKQTQQLNSELEHFKNKAAYFFGLSNAINLFKRSVRSAYDTVKDLDAVMTETAVVTNFDVGDMWAQLPEYTQRANELGVSIHSAYEAATIFYQQGLKTNEVMAVSNETLKMARIAGLDAATASDRMTNALRGFNMEMDKVSAQRVNDVYSKLAAITASNTDEISTAMTKVASLAHNANMEFETTSAFLAQIIESTRESAETAGTALKTVVARFSEVKKLYSKGQLMGNDEEGEAIDVNKVSTALRSAGINLNEYLTGSKGLDDIFIELAEKWDSLDKVQQRYIATMAAGSRQQSRFIALMSDYKRTVELVDAANTANGASEEQYGKTLESLQTKLARLKNAWDEFILGLTNSDVIKGAVDALTDLITNINKLIKAISNKNAGVKMITTFFTAFTAFKVGSKMVGKNSGLSKFFASFVGADATQLASMKAGQLAQSFYSSLADKIANPGNKALNTNSTAAMLKNYFLPVTDKTFISSTLSNSESFQGALYDSLDFSKMSSGEFKELWATVEKGDLTVGELNAALTKANQNFQITGKNANQFGIGVNNSTVAMRLASVAAIALGTALMNIGNNLEQQEGAMSAWGTWIKALGVGLVTFGTIMSVYLPLQAQLMARGVTSAIVSIPIVGWIVGIISALVALGVAIYNISKNNSLETRLEKANDDLKAATEAAEDAKKAYEDLGAAWEDLGNKYDIIEKATQGTKEWKEAVRQVNEAVLQLANTYDNVKISRDEDGILHITNQQEIDDSLAEQVANSDAATRMTKIRNLELKRQKDLAELSNSMEYGHIAEDLYASGELQGFNEKTKDEIKQLIVSRYGEDYVSDEEIKKMQEFALNTSDTDELINSQMTAFGASIMDKAGLSKEERKYANAFLNNNYIDKQRRDTRKEIEENWDGNKIKDEYARSKGEIDYKTYKAKNPDDKTSLEGMKDSIVGTKLLEKGAVQTIDFINRLKTLSDEEKALFAGENGSGLTQEDYNKLSKANFDKTNLYYKTGGSEVWGDQDAFNRWFEESLKGAFNNFDLSNFGEDFKSKINTELVKNLDSDTYKNFINNLSSVYSSSGKEGMEIVQNTIKEMSKKVDPDKMNDFINSLNGIDWSNADSIQNLEDLAKQYGISEKEIKRFKDQIIEFNNATNKVDFEKFSEIIGLLQKIANGEQGRSFTAEQYEQLLANGVKPDDFSYNSATNTYDYKGADVQELVTSVVKRLDSEITQLGKQSKSNQAVEKSIDTYGTNLTDVSKMRQFLFTYNKNAGKDSLVNLDMLRNGGDDQIRLAYKQVMDTYNKQSDIEADLDQAKALRYQMSTGSELSEAIKNTGDTGAIDALASKLVAAGLPKDLVDGLMPYVTSEAQGGGVVNGATKEAGNLVDIVNEANQFGISVEDLNTYAAALRSVKGLEDERADTLYRLALANARYQDGIKKLSDTYDDWIKLKQKDGSIRANNGDPAQLKAYEQLKKTLKEVLNTSKDISDEFLEAPENVALIEKAAKGDAKAISQLRANMAKVDLSKLGIKPQALDEIYSKIDEFAKNAPDLKFGATLDDSKYAKTLAEMLEQAGLTGEEMEEVFKQIGWSPEVEYVAMDWEDVQKQNTSGWQEIMHPDGTKEKVPVDGLSEYAIDGKVMVPRFGKGTKFVKPTKPAGGNKNKKKKAGGGGSKKSTKKSYWENPYDELYNLQQKINEALRTRESLERRYQKLLKQEQATLEDIRKSYYAQITNLRSEANLQKQFAEGRLRQINNLGNKIYTDENGKRKTFKSLGVTKYASYNTDTGLLTIDWEGLEAISKNSKRTNEGKAAEAYISKLEELVGSYEEVRDKLWSIEDEIENLRQTAIESYLSFEDRVMESLVTKYQQQIDSYQAMSDALDKANNEVINSLREQVDLSRQIRDNTEKENEISDMENRLAYLQRDTSGANALEVQKLQKDLEDAREGYTDTLIDQAIDKIQKDADVAAEQRARQIETMTEQLEIMKNTGALWQQVYDLIDEAGDGNGALSSQSNLVELLKKSEAFASLSNIGQEKWWSEVAEQFHAAWVGRGESEDKYKRDANNDGIVNNTDTQDTIDSVAQTATTVQPTAATTVNHTDKDKYGVALAVSEGSYGWGVGETRAKNLKAKGFNPDEIQAIINKVANDVMAGTWSGKYYGIKDLSPYKLSKFKQGGLADFTGPAWLDGTKTRPELILNAQDSRNFITLKDILASLMSSSNANGGIINEAKQVNVDIQATIQGDYDVDRMVERVKKDIYDDGQYRNVNAISFLR